MRSINAVYVRCNSFPTAPSVLNPFLLFFLYIFFSFLFPFYILVRTIPTILADSTSYRRAHIDVVNRTFFLDLVQLVFLRDGILFRSHSFPSSRRKADFAFVKAHPESFVSVRLYIRMKSRLSVYAIDEKVHAVGRYRKGSIILVIVP